MNNTMIHVKSYLFICVILIFGIITILQRTQVPFGTAFLEENLSQPPMVQVFACYNDTSTSDKRGTSRLNAHLQYGDVDGNETSMVSYLPVTEAKKSKILILTYMRSGSTLTSGILQQSGKSFFSMEPLWGIYRRCYRRKYDVCCRNDTCRSPKGEIEGLQVAIEALKDIFNCNFDSLRIDILSSFTFFPESSGYAGLRNRGCFSFGNNKTLRDRCLHYLKSICEVSSSVVVKTLRLSAETMTFLKDVVPDLEIVHLFRDPRGVLNSRRIIGDFIDRNINISNYARQLCNRMSYDIDILKSSGINYIPIRYECLSDNPNLTVRKLYKRLNITLTKEVKDWIQRHMSADSRNSGGYGYQFKKSGIVAHSWRHLLDFKSIKAVDAMCSRFYDKSGIAKISNLSLLNDLKFSTYSGDVYSNDIC